MTMPAYNLDDRRWADLADEGQALIPLYAPDWTDFNASDPGITLMELFAWLAEMNIYRLNRITDQQTRKFLALVGLYPEPPRAARTVLTFALKDKAAALSVPAHLEFVADSPLGDTVTVQALRKLSVVPAALQAVQVGTSAGYRDMTSRWQRGEAFCTFGDDPAPGAALYLGFDRCISPGTPISLVFTVDDPTASATARDALVAEARAQAADCQGPNYGTLCGPPITPIDNPEDESPSVPPHFSVRLAWEYLDTGKRWLRVEGPSSDSTRALTLNGGIEFKFPTTNAMGKGALGHVPTEYYYVRGRIVSGAYDAAPTLINVALNAVEALQAVPSGASRQITPAALRLETLGLATGWPDQVCTLSQNPVVAASVRFYSQEGDNWHRWHLVADLDGSGPTDRHAVLDASAGTITVGNGEHGWVPPSGAELYAGYLATLADAGKLAANSVLTLAATCVNNDLLTAAAAESDESATVAPWNDRKISPASITLAVALSGGAAAETLDHAEGRAFGLPEQPTRAVTLADYQTLAAATPGVRLARVTALANVHPHFPCIQAPGVVTVIVVPFLPVGRPAPSDGLLRAVRAYLARRRILGTRIEVIGPNYVEITVQTVVQAAKGADAVALSARIVSALQTFFDPLVGGPAGSGWPFGREVVQAEVLAVIARTAGVDHVVSLALSVNGGPPQCGNACVGFAGLVASGAHQVTVTGAS